MNVLCSISLSYTVKVYRQYTGGIQPIERLQAGKKTSASEAGRGGRKQSGLTEMDYCGNHIHDGSTSVGVKI